MAIVSDECTGELEYRGDMYEHYIYGADGNADGLKLCFGKFTRETATDEKLWCLERLDHIEDMRSAVGTLTLYRGKRLDHIEDMRSAVGTLTL